MRYRILINISIKTQTNKIRNDRIVRNQTFSKNHRIFNCKKIVREICEKNNEKYKKKCQNSNIDF